MDEHMTPIEGRARFGRPYRRIAAVVTVAVGILGAGLLGPHRVGPATPTLAPAPVAGSTTAVASGGGSNIPSQPVVRGIDGLVGLTQVKPDSGEILQSWLPGQITSRSMAVAGGRLFYVVDGDQIQSTEVGAVGARISHVTVPRCEGINQLAAVGHELAYVVTTPGGSTSQIDGCAPAGGRIAWSLWLLDLNGGSPRQVASGFRAALSIQVTEFPIHLALTETAYAFDRPPFSSVSALGETIEVHSIDGSLLWTSQSKRPVADVMLGGGTLAILTDVLDRADGVVDLWTSDAAHPGFAPVDQPATSVSLSPDGSHLTWDVVPHAASPGFTPLADVAVETVETGIEVPLVTETNRVAPAPLRPAISSTSRGLVVTWFATAPDGGVYPAIRDVAGGNGFVLPSFQEPVWMKLVGGTLFWVAESADGWSKAVYAVNLSALGLN